MKTFVIIVKADDDLSTEDAIQSTMESVGDMEIDDVTWIQEPVYSSATFAYVIDLTGGYLPHNG